MTLKIENKRTFLSPQSKRLKNEESFGSSKRQEGQPIQKTNYGEREREKR